MTILCFFLSSSLSSLEEAGGLVRFGGGFRAGGESVSDDGACVGRLEFGRGAGVGDLIGGVATFGVGFDVDVDALGGSSSSSESGSVAESRFEGNCQQLSKFLSPASGAVALWRCCAVGWQSVD